MGDSMAAFSMQSIGEFCSNEDVYNVAVPALLGSNWFTNYPNSDTAAWLPACVDAASVESIWVAIGGNDFLYSNCPTTSGFRSEYTTTLNAIIGSLRSHFPNAGIVLTGYSTPYTSFTLPGFDLSGCVSVPTMHWLNAIQAEVAGATEDTTYVNITNALGADWNTWSNADFFTDAYADTPDTHHHYPSPLLWLSSPERTRTRCMSAL